MFPCMSTQYVPAPSTTGAEIGTVYGSPVPVYAKEFRVATTVPGKPPESEWKTTLKLSTGPEPL